jgi:uncharacterized protein
LSERELPNLFCIFTEKIQDLKFMTNKKEILLFLKRNKKFLKENYHCNEIGLFGSFARNEQTAESDIDFLVEFDPDTPDLYNVEIELKNFLKKQFNREVDICAKKWIKPIYMNLVMKDAIYA